MLGAVGSVKCRGVACCPTCQGGVTVPSHIVCQRQARASCDAQDQVLAGSTRAPFRALEADGIRTGSNFTCWRHGAQSLRVVVPSEVRHTKRTWTGSQSACLSIFPPLGPPLRQLTIQAPVCVRATQCIVLGTTLSKRVGANLQTAADSLQTNAIVGVFAG
jgi:hypothetical protein